MGSIPPADMSSYEHCTVQYSIATPIDLPRCLQLVIRMLSCGSLSAKAAYLRTQLATVVCPFR